MVINAEAAGSILRATRSLTGLRTAAIVRFDGPIGTALAVHDDGGLGLVPGFRLPSDKTY